MLGERLGRTDVDELRTRIGLSTAALAERVPPDERVLDVVVTAAWSVVGRWRESYDPQDEARARALLDQLGVGRAGRPRRTAPSPRASASGSRSPGR